MKKKNSDVELKEWLSEYESSKRVKNDGIYDVQKNDCEARYEYVRRFSGWYYARLKAAIENIL
jgi:hypothetical protein